MSLRDDFETAFNSYRSKPQKAVAMKSAVLKEAKDQLVPYNTFQTNLRALYGNGPPKDPRIGDHPDFEYLKDTDNFCYHPITTLFMDIESSTRLSLIYSLEDVFRIKNAFIRSAMEVIQSFDGHVHRIMGDAVMAYFGGTSCNMQKAAVDALNCASVLMYFAKRVIIPLLQLEKYDSQFGIRIGMDYGRQEDVLWSCYGYPGMNEVTATSFYVDVASKLQHAAGRNEIMIGHSLRSFLDFPDQLLAIKTVQRDGKEIEKPRLEPNHTDASGKSIDYSQRLLKWQKYLSYSPMAIKDRDFLSPNSSTDIVPVSAKIYPQKDAAAAEGLFIATSTVLPKEKWLKFSVAIPHQLRYPFRVRFIVENHGEEALREAGPELGNHETPYTISSEAEKVSLKHWEHTLYRGLHFLTILVESQSRVIARVMVGVFIE